MNSTSAWQRVSKRRPCPICGKPDWCLFSGPDDSPDAAICARAESGRRCGEGGWLHVLRDDGPTWSPRVRRIELSAAQIAAATTDFAKLAADFRAAVRPEALSRLAVGLGVFVESLRRLGVGWASKHGAWAFPMYNADGKTLGIRLRLPGGRKLAVKGGKEGLFIPDALNVTGNRLLIAEGPTDTAAILDFGFMAIGRSSCTGGVALLIELARKLKPAGVVVVADADAPGRRGAESLAGKLAAYCRDVRVISPPAGAKDARDWKRKGATAADVEAAIDAAPVRKLRVSVRKRKAEHDAKRK
ncbi:MAG: hypothetical protein L6306_01275 [Planctomycetales bacterium]|nr:hypothetical protein [Planctomycetales bacterium]